MYQNDVAILKNQIEETQSQNLEQFATIEKKLTSVADQSTRLNLAFLRGETRSGMVDEKLLQINSVVGDLQKLTTMDPELLKKYSKIYFLNEHYVPQSLSQIDANYLLNPASSMQIHANVLPFLNKMLEASARDGVQLKIVSAFRSFGAQATLKSSYKVTYGAGTANAFSAEQGYSEHQLGTTLDFTNPKVGNTFSGFDKTDEYKWLVQNAYKYGFVISYPKENTYYMYEPWHWRFVGTSLASLVHDKNSFFYAIDQREIDTYLGKMFDQ